MFASKYDETEAFQHLERVVMQLPHAKETDNGESGAV